MPKSKRAKVVSLTQVKKSVGIEKKQKLVQMVQSACDEYNTIFVITQYNARNSKMKEIRERFPTSRFFFGKNRVMARALGFDEASEYKPGFVKISEHLQGEAGLFFTNEDKDDMLNFFRTYKELDYARAGFVPVETIERHAGPIELPHNLEPFIRNLGMPTRLQKGVIHLEGDFKLCTAGLAITPEQAKLLKTFEIKLAEFRFDVKAVWEAKDGDYEFELFEEDEE